MRLLVATFFSVLLYSPNALASDLTLAWQAPAGCPTLEDVRAGLATRLGRPVQLGPDAPLRVEAAVTPEREGFRLMLVTHTERGESRRELSAPSCNELSRATVLLASLLLSTQAAAKSVPLPPSAAAQQALTPGFRATLAALLEAGRLPRFGPGVAARLGVDLAALSLEAGALYLPARSTAVEQAAGAQATLQLLAASVEVCYALTRGPRLAPCAYFELGSLMARGQGLAQDERSASLWLSGGLGAQLGLPLTSWLGLQVELDAGLPLRRVQLATRDQGLVYRVSAWNSQLQLGLTASFP